MSDKLKQPLTESQATALVAHLKGYIHLMETIWPNEPDAVKTQAKALLDEINAANPKEK